MWKWKERPALLFVRGRGGVPPCFVWLISHQPAVLFSQNKPATSNQPAVFFSQNKSAPAISHQPNEQAANLFAVREVAVGHFTWPGSSCCWAFHLAGIKDGLM
jgi:hypothetical protein